MNTERPKSILVTGGSGMLGRALAGVLPDAVYLSSKNGDLREPSEARKIFKHHAPDIVIHLAAKVGGVKENAERNSDFLTDNVLINTNVVSIAAASGVKRFITLLSSCAYPFHKNMPMAERHLHEGLPFHGNLGYGYAKRLLDIHCQLAEEQYGMQSTTLTPATMFGPWDNFDLETGHVVGALITKCLTQTELSVWGDGTAVRQFVFVNDIARIIVELLGRKEAGNIIAVADEGITIRALAEAVSTACNFSGKVLFDAGKPTGLTKKIMMSERFSESFPKFRFTPLDEALAETVRWHQCTF